MPIHSLSAAPAPHLCGFLAKLINSPFVGIFLSCLYVREGSWRKILANFEAGDEDVQKGKILHRSLPSLSNKGKTHLQC